MLLPNNHKGFVHLLPVLVLAILVVGLVVAVTSLKKNQDVRSKAAGKSQGLSQQEQKRQALVKQALTLQQQTNQVSLLADNLTAHPENKGKVTEALAPLLEKRKQILSDLITQDPATAQRYMLADNELAAIRGATTTNVEAKVTLTGTYTSFHIDDFKNPENTQYFHGLTVGNNHYYLYSQNDFTNVESGSQLSVEGYKIGNDMILVSSAHQDGEQVLGISTDTQGQVLGKRTTSPIPTPLPKLDVAVVFANFSDTNVTYDLSSWQATMKQVADYYNEQSFGKTPMTFGIYGPFKLSFDSSHCSGMAFGGPLGGEIMQETPQVPYIKDSKTGEVLTRGIFLVPCPRYLLTTSTDTGWHIYNTGGAAYIAHELGHTLGAPNIAHSDAKFCLPHALQEPCSWASKGDMFDVMGYSDGLLKHFNSKHKYEAGWLSSANYVTVPTAAGTYTYTISPLESPSSGPMVVNIPNVNNPNGNLLLEYRQPIGFDSYFGNVGCTFCNVTQGVSIKYGIGGQDGDNSAIDASPGSYLVDGYQLLTDLSNGALLPGQTFTDPRDNGVTIKTISANASGATVQITVPSVSCTRGIPTWSVSPTSQTAVPGETKTYTLTAKNNDSSACSPNKFSSSDFDRISPAGVVSTNYYPNSLTLSPGQTGTFTYTVASPATAQDSTYTIYSVLSSSYYIQPKGKQTAYPPPFTYQIVTPLPNTQTAPPAPTSVSASAVGSGQVNLSWTAPTNSASIVGYYVFRNGQKIATVTNTSYSDYSLVGGLTYSYYVQTFDTHYVSINSDTISAITPAKTDTESPSSPTMTATVTKANEVTLTWASATDNTGVVAYAINQYSGGLSTNVNTPGLWNKTTVIATVDGNTTSYVDKNLLYSAPYGYIVQAIDAAGNITGSTEQDVMTGAFGLLPPTEPTNVVGTMDLAAVPGPCKVDLTWNASTDDKGVARYDIYRYWYKIGTSTTNSYVDTRVAPSGGAYAYSVQAFDSDGNMSFKTPLTGVTFLGNNRGVGYECPAPAPL